MSALQGAPIVQSVINQGDIYWVHIEKPNVVTGNDSEAGEAELRLPHPHVVIQENLFNHSRINTVIVCALTSNLKRANEPGNLLLEAGEANLPKQSVVVVSQLSTAEKTQLGNYIGALSKRRIEQILAGIRFQQTAFFAR